MVLMFYIVFLRIRIFNGNKDIKSSHLAGAGGWNIFFAMETPPWFFSFLFWTAVRTNESVYEWKSSSLNSSILLILTHPLQTTFEDKD